MRVHIHGETHIADRLRELVSQTHPFRLSESWPHFTLEVYEQDTQPRLLVDSADGPLEATFLRELRATMRRDKSLGGLETIELDFAANDDPKRLSIGVPAHFATAAQEHIARAIWIALCTAAEHGRPRPWWRRAVGLAIAGLLVLSGAAAAQTSEVTQGAGAGDLNYPWIVSCVNPVTHALESCAGAGGGGGGTTDTDDGSIAGGQAAVLLNLNLLQLWNGAAWVRAPGDATNGLKVQATVGDASGSAITSTATPASNARGLVVRNVPTGTQTVSVNGSVLTTPANTAAMTNATLAALNATVVSAMQATTTFYVDPGLVGTIVFESAIDPGLTYDACGAWLDDGTYVTSVSSFPVKGVFACTGARVRLRVSAYTSGSAGAWLSLSHSSFAMPGQHVNFAALNGVAPATGNGAAGAGVQRVVVASDNSPVPTKLDQTSTNNDVDVASIAAGVNIIGKVGIDQTTNGTTNRVNIGADGSVKVTDGTSTQAVKAASTAAAATDPSAVVALSPNSNTVKLDQTSTSNDVDVASIAAGANTIGKVGIDQTTNGTTNRVNIGSDGTVTANIGTTGGLALEAGNLATVASAVRAEDSASADADKGVTLFAVRKATPANTSGTDGDYEALQISAGRLWASAVIDTALPAGGNVIGSVGQSGTWAQNLTQIAGTGVVTGGLAGSIAIGGTAGNNAAITENPIVIGFEARSTAPTQATNGNQIRSTGDLAGNQYNVMPLAWSCNLQALAATLTQCQAAPAAGYSLYVTAVIATTTTTTAGTFAIRAGTGTNCATGPTGVWPAPGLASPARTVTAPISTAAPMVLNLGPVGLKLTAANAVCVIGTATNTIDISLSGYIAP